MKITCTKKEDILRRKAEYEADVERRREEHDAQYQKYLEAQEAVYAPVKKELEYLLSKYPRLKTEVYVEDAPFRERGLRIRIRVNDRDVHAKDKALSWDYEAYIKDDEVYRETGSWSGLQAVTSEQLEQLEQSLMALKELKDLDWMKLLDRTLPSYGDYITVDDPRYDRDKPNFEQELIEAEFEDIIGKRKMIEVQPFESSWYRGNVFIAIVKESPTQYTIIESPSRKSYNTGEYMYDPTEAFDKGSTHRVKKSNIVPVKPLNVIEV